MNTAMKVILKTAGVFTVVIIGTFIAISAVPEDAAVIILGLGAFAAIGIMIISAGSEEAEPL